MLKNFCTALAFLTIFRIPFTDSLRSPKELAASFTFFPVAGAILGLVYCSAALLLSNYVPSPLPAVIITSLMVLLTRGLHFDGLADFADSIWGGSTPERRLEIMKDSRSGAFGVLALIMDFSLKAVSIHLMVAAGYIAPLFAAPVFSRFAMAATAYRSNYAGKEGLGRPFLENIRMGHLLAVALLTATAAFPAGAHAILYLIPVLSCLILFRFFSRRYLGGITGDVLGAVNEVSEIAVLVVGACAARHF